MANEEIIEDTQEEETPVLQELPPRIIEEQGEDIDETIGVEFDPETQKIQEYKMVNYVDGKRVVQNVKKIVEKTPFALEEDRKKKEQQAIDDRVKFVNDRISDLKYKVAI